MYAGMIKSREQQIGRVRNAGVVLGVSATLQVSHRFNFNPSPLCLSNLVFGHPEMYNVNTTSETV